MLIFLFYIIIKLDCESGDTSLIVRRNVAITNNIRLFSLPKFYSLIVLKKLEDIQLSNLGKMESLLKIETFIKKDSKHVSSFNTGIPK